MSRGTLPLAFAFPVCILRMGSSALALPLLPPDGPSQVCACSLHSTLGPLLASAVLWATVGKELTDPLPCGVWGPRLGEPGVFPGRAGRLPTKGWLRQDLGSWCFRQWEQEVQRA